MSMSKARMDRLLSDKDVAISNIAGYSDKILCTCAHKDYRLIAIKRTQRGPGAPVWGMKMSTSNERMDRGPIGTAHLLAEEAEQTLERDPAWRQPRSWPRWACDTTPHTIKTENTTMIPLPPVDRLGYEGLWALGHGGASTHVELW